MNESFFMLTLLVPGSQSPGKDMDVFLRPLVDELKELWSRGAPTRDTVDNRLFRMRAALLFTINNFPARSHLSDWSGQGYKACPTCNKDTPSMLVCGKTVYVGPRCYLPTGHHLRNSKDFNGKTERRHPPPRISNEELLDS